MRKLNFILLFIFSCLVTIGQEKVNVLVPFTDQSPSLDGVEDAVWDQVPANQIDTFYTGEEPTVTAYWKALWNYTALYVLVSVEDDDLWPAWVSGGDWWVHDQPEVYFDVNEDLEDGRGPGTDQGTGHYQAQPDFTDGGSGTVQSLEASNYRPGGSYCYQISGENYVFEYAFDYTSFVNNDQTTLDAGAFDALDEIGFDVYVIDQDEGVTTDRQRAVWQNTGENGENYSNMDDAGTITLVDELPGPTNIKNNSIAISIYPNPVADYLTINTQFDRLSIVDITGKEIKTIVGSENKINLESLSKGIYLVQIFNRGNSVGVWKFSKM